MDNPILLLSVLCLKRSMYVEISVLFVKQTFSPTIILIDWLKRFIFETEKTGPNTHKKQAVFAYGNLQGLIDDDIF